MNLESSALSLYSKYIFGLLKDYEEEAIFRCVENSATVEVILSATTSRAAGAGFDEHIFMPGVVRAGVVRSPDSDREIADRLQRENLSLLLAKDLVGTEQSRSEGAGFMYAVSPGGGAFIATKDAGNRDAIRKLVNFGKSWGLLLLGYRSRTNIPDDPGTHCPDIVVLPVHRLDGYILVACEQEPAGPVNSA